MSIRALQRGKMDSIETRGPSFRRAMQKKQPEISVRVVGWTGVGAPLVRVLVDEVSVGVLNDKRPHRFPIDPGRRRIRVRRDFLRSEFLEFDVSARQSAEFECGHRHVRHFARTLAGRMVLVAACIGSAIMVAVLKLPFWSVYVVIGLATVAMAVDWWRCYILPGAYLYLRKATRSGATGNRS